MRASRYTIFSPWVSIARRWREVQIAIGRLEVYQSENLKVAIRVSSGCESGSKRSKTDYFSSRYRIDFRLRNRRVSYREKEV